MAFVQVSGMDVAYARAGDGPPLVLVHGAGLDGRMWLPQLAGLAGEFTVVAWDEPGAGRSSDLQDGFGLADFAHCLAAVSDRPSRPRRTRALTRGVIIMILVLASLVAVFLAGSVCGIFAMVVLGIHAEERRVGRDRAASSPIGAASRRLLSTRTCDDVPERVRVGR